MLATCRYYKVGNFIQYIVKLYIYTDILYVLALDYLSFDLVLTLILANLYIIFLNYKTLTLKITYNLSENTTTELQHDSIQYKNHSKREKLRTNPGVPATERKKKRLITIKRKWPPTNGTRTLKLRPIVLTNSFLIKFVKKTTEILFIPAFSLIF